MKTGAIIGAASAAIISLLLIVRAFVWRTSSDAAPAAEAVRIEAPVRLRPARIEKTDTAPEPALIDPAGRIRRAAASGAAWLDVQDMLDELARENPRLALQLAEELGQDDRQRYLAMRDLVDRWSRRDPAAALEWSIPQLRRWDGMEASFSYLVLQRAAQSDPAHVTVLAQEAIARWSQSAGAEPAELAYAAVNALLGNGDASFAREAIEHWAGAGLIEKIGRDALERVAWRMADESLPESIAWLQRLPAVDTRHDVLANVVARWAEHEPAAAATWAEALDQAQGRDEVLRQALAAWAGADPLAAANWIAQRDADPAADPMLADLSAHSPLATEDPNAALKFAALIENPELRTASVDAILVAWHERDPAAAAHFVAQSDHLAPADRARLLQVFRELPAP